MSNVMASQGNRIIYSSTPIQGSPKSTRGREMGNLMAGLCLYTLHFIVTVIVFVASVTNNLFYLLFATGSVEKYKASQGKKPQIVGVVIDSQEVEAQAFKICDLLSWLADIGVQHVSLYDMEGVLKKYRRVLEKTLGDLDKGIQFIDAWEERKKVISKQTAMTVELLSLCDGKEGIAKAARYLCSETMHKIDRNGQHANLKLTEADIDRGLAAAGCAGPEPDLLFVFGFTRCLLGFPAWRLRFTEIIYMGMLKSLTLTSLLKALGDFSKKNQRYGT